MLFLMLLLAVSSSGLLLANAQSHSRASSDHYLRSMGMMSRLNTAKVALLAYALTYADNYGATGAGPGHFPCPDTDPPDDGNPRNDGPDPPCGQNSVAAGRVPRLTRLRSTAVSPAKVLEFYPLLSLMDQQPWYFLAGSYINNPLNRQVNPDTGGLLALRFATMQGHLSNRLMVTGDREVIAVIAAPGSELRQHHQQRPGIAAGDYLENENADLDETFQLDYQFDTNDLLLQLRQQELMPLLKRRIAGKVSDWIVHYHQRQCPESESPQVAWQVAHTLIQNPVSVPSVPDLTAAGVACYPYAAKIDEFDCEDSLFEGALGLSPGSCNDALAPGNRLDDVSLPRHWFVRNNWHHHVRYRLDSRCNAGGWVVCRIKIELGEEDGLIVASIELANEA